METHYHLRRTEKAITSPDVLTEILRNGRYATLALCHDAQPYAVTMNYGYDGEHLYFHCALHGRKMTLIRANPSVCATVIDDLGYRAGQCDHAFRSVVLHGIIETVDDLPEKRHALNVLIRHLEPDPDPVAERLINTKGVESVGILRLRVLGITGKVNS